MKRLFDIVFSLAMLIILSPLLFVIALVIKLSDPGPVLYRQTRIGLHGKPFKVLKFRSMKHNHAFTSEITIQRDPRITSIGHLLRETKMDELPQLWNVLRGEMSVVGPRPETPRYVAYFTEEERKTLALRPGLTGPASVIFRSQGNLLGGMDYEQYYITVMNPAKARINLDYMRHQSFWLDLKIILHTVIVLVHPTPAPPLVAPTEAEQTPTPRLTPAPAPTPRREEPVHAMMYPPAHQAEP